MPKKQNICSYGKCNKKVRAIGLCITHYTQKWRKENPVKSSYLNLRANSKRRGKQFEISFDEFKDVCIETEYIQGKGRTAKGYTLDRLEDEKGYTKDNIGIKTNSENVKKQRRREKILKYEYQHKIAFYQELKKEISKNEDVPF